MPFPALSLPSFPHQLSQKEGVLHIYDILRKAHVKLTPEEWVRQHAVHYLISKNYPQGLMQIEGGLKYNKMSKRCDLLVFGTQGLPFLLVECKAAHVPINEQVWLQAHTYNQTIRAPYIWLTNGLDNFCWQTPAQGPPVPLQGLPEFVR
jgi:type I site-specific restriction endonuclease